MENLGKRAQKELLLQIDATIEELQRLEHNINRYFEYILKAVITYPMTDAAIEGFEKDWKNVYGDKTILDF